MIRYIMMIESMTMKTDGAMNGAVNMKLRLSKDMFNPAYDEIDKATERVKIIYGGSGSGKSYSITVKLLLKVIQNRGCNILVTRKVGNTLRHSVFALFKQIINRFKLHDLFTVKETDMVIVFKPNGNQIICKGLDDRERLKSITFPNGILTDIWIEEASEVDKEDFVQLNLRLRGLSSVDKQIIISFNPVSAESWLKSYFFDSEYECYILKTTYKHNKFVGEEYAKELEALKLTDPLYWEVYCNGNWGIIDSSNCIISLKDLVKAKTTTLDNVDGEIVISCDVARFGDDSTVIFHRKGYKVFTPIHIKKCTLVQVADRITTLYEELRGYYPSTKITINIDSTGLGAGVVDIVNAKRLKNCYVNAISFSNAPMDRDKYYDITSEMMFNVRDILRDEEVELPAIEVLITELGGRLYTIDNKGRYKAENKQDYKKRIGRSPDYADALMLLFYKPRQIIFL